ncbi:Asp23/Gls24 family envelope stress response protein [Parafrankia sp. BMG5.11]|uniref:Asp23/Gls24 family envelope stress response protein n=1 Tax=Parafrankia sp. BMG5.11 TaxID=222540 RepID=UPI00103A2535|nr:Asp23/Gls24 family envelope stress response protein [Parafrankia sp. BMG5.11]TCJ36816.1 Asp23/Gls24 family envelope stress response protein [Parafrankia sp. BMG5.11]
MSPDHLGGGAGGPGRLLVAERVVAKIAAIAAADVEAVAGPPPRAATRVAAFLRDGSPGGRPSGRPEATVRVVDGAAWVSLTLSITYPASVSQTTQAVRDRVRERVAALAGLPVARIDIDIPLLSAGAGP